MCVSQLFTKSIRVKNKISTNLQIRLVPTKITQKKKNAFVLPKSGKELCSYHYFYHLICKNDQRCLHYLLLL